MAGTSAIASVSSASSFVSDEKGFFAPTPLPKSLIENPALHISAADVVSARANKGVEFYCSVSRGEVVLDVKPQPGWAPPKGLSPELYKAQLEQFRNYIESREEDLVVEANLLQKLRMRVRSEKDRIGAISMHSKPSSERQALVQQWLERAQKTRDRNIEGAREIWELTLKGRTVLSANQEALMPTDEEHAAALAEGISARVRLRE
jgi:hypothetical protein